MKLKKRMGYVFGRLNCESKRLSRHPLAVYKRIRDDGAVISPYLTLERRVVGKKIVNIEYHKIDWAKNFAACRKDIRNG